MELTNEQKQHLAEVELCIDRYFDAQVKPMMVGTQRELTRHQIHERAEYDMSFAGVVQSIRPYGAMAKDVYLKNAGEWNGKTTEDYFSMCRDNIQKSEVMQRDLSMLADVWRTRMVQVIGREAYDTHSQKLGSDLATAYVAYRVEGRMIGHMVDQRVSKDSVEYVLKKGMDSSLIGFLSTVSQKTELDEMLDTKAEKAYNPSLAENLTGRALGLGVDIMSTGGAGSWTKLGWTAGAEAVVQGGEWIYGKYLEDSQPRSVEDIVSKTVLGSKGNVMAEIQQESRTLNHDGNNLALAMNEQMGGRMLLMTDEMRERIDIFGTLGKDPWAMTRIEPDDGQKPYEGISAPMLPEEQQVEEHKHYETQPLNSHTMGETQKEQEPDLSQVQPIETEQARQHTPPAQSTDGWGSMLTTLGLNDMGSVGRNLGYVVAMLPDLMVGLFTGKSNGLKLMKDNMLPLASILMGLFVRNPLLKMTLVGLGGMNLLNKAGHEAIERKNVADGVSVPREVAAPQYRRYEDQPLNSRMRGPEIREGALFATVDGVPCTIRLPEKVLAAYEAGSLPLNTLANAVLAKSDAMNQVARENYDATQEEAAQRNLHV